MWQGRFTTWPSQKVSVITFSMTDLSKVMGQVALLLNSEVDPCLANCDCLLSGPERDFLAHRKVYPYHAYQVPRNPMDPQFHGTRFAMRITEIAEHEDGRRFWSRTSDDPRELKRKAGYTFTTCRRPVVTPVHVKQTLALPH